jgi:hypothetical protein
MDYRLSSSGLPDISDAFDPVVTPWPDTALCMSMSVSQVARTSSSSAAVRPIRTLERSPVARAPGGPACRRRPALWPWLSPPSDAAGVTLDGVAAVVAAVAGHVEYRDGRSSRWRMALIWWRYMAMNATPTLSTVASTVSRTLTRRARCRRSGRPPRCSARRPRCRGNVEPRPSVDAGVTRSSSPGR